VAEDSYFTVFLGSWYVTKSQGVRLAPVKSCDFGREVFKLP